MSCCSLLAAVFGLPVSPLVASARKRSLLAQLGGKFLLPINFLDFSLPEGQGPRIACLLSDPTRSLFLPALIALICLNHTALARGKSDFSM